MQYYLAQALAIRAFDYFTLVQLYQFNYKGHESAMGLPLITEQNAAEVAANGCTRSTVQETYDFILADLNKAIELLTATTKERDDKRYVSLDVVLRYPCPCLSGNAQLCGSFKGCGSCTGQNYCHSILPC